MRSAIRIPLALVALLTLAGCERYALDRQMEELCKKDGGVKVYETVTLPPNEFEAIWTYARTAKSDEDFYGPNYRLVLKREILRGEDSSAQNGGGQLDRLYSALYRRSDDRLLGEQVLYRRSGGDLLATFGFQPSKASCPQIEQGVARAVFLRGK